MDWQSLKGLFCPDPRRAVSIWLKFNLDFPLLCSTRLHHPISWYFFETKNVIILKHSNKYFVLIDHHQHWQLCVRRDPICAPTLSQPTPSSPKTNTHNIPFKQIQKSCRTNPDFFQTKYKEEGEPGFFQKHQTLFVCNQCFPERRRPALGWEKKSRFVIFACVVENWLVCKYTRRWLHDCENNPSLRPLGNIAMHAASDPQPNTDDERNWKRNGKNAIGEK